MNTLARIALTSIAAAVLSSSAAGCVVQQDDDELLAEDAAALSSENSRSAGLGRAVLSPIQASDTADADQAAGAVETRPIAGFYPAGCVTAAREGLKVHLQFDDCTGPFGLVHLKGGIDATFSLGEAGLHAELADSGDLTVQDQPVDYRAATDITVEADAVDLDWSATWNGTTTGGKAFTHDADLDLSADPLTGCATMSGTASGSVEDRGMDSVIEGYAVCPAACPSAGKITSTGKKSGRTIVVEFDGSDVAKVTGPRGNSFDVPLVCDAAE